MTIKEAYKTAVLKEVSATNHTSWGAANSVAVIEAITDAAYLDGENEGFGAIRMLVSNLVNPSAFRQQLEKLPLTDPAHIVPTVKTARASAALDMLK